MKRKNFYEKKIIEKNTCFCKKNAILDSLCAKRFTTLSVLGTVRSLSNFFKKLEKICYKIIVLIF